MKKTVLTVLAALLLLLPGMTSCANRAPSVEAVYDRVVTLVEGAKELNTVIYGEGLPTYPEGGEYAELNHIYFGFSYPDQYEFVTPYAKFLSSEDFRERAEQIYSTAYLESAIYPALFSGYAIEDPTDGDNSIFADARYLEDENWFYQLKSAKSYLTGMRLWDYSTMKIVQPSTSEAIYLTVDTHLEASPDEILSVRLRLVLQDGEWFLDSFSG